MKFLIDECLSPELAKRARERGHPESSHVVWVGRRGWKDWELMPFIIDGDWTFVTKNSIDFRGSSANPGGRGQYADVALHAGLVCLNGPQGMDLEMQNELFELVLDEASIADDLMNQVIEVSADDVEVRILRYGLPK